MISKKSKMRFSKWVVIYCVAIGTIITAAALIISYRAGSITSGIISALLAFWGGELMLVCLTKVLEAEKPKKKDDTNKPTI